MHTLLCQGGEQCSWCDGVAFTALLSSVVATNFTKRRIGMGLQLHLRSRAVQVLVELLPCWLINLYSVVSSHEPPPGVQRPERSGCSRRRCTGRGVCRPCSPCPRRPLPSCRPNSQHDGGHVRTPSGELASGASASLMSWHRTFHPPNGLSASPWLYLGERRSARGRLRVQPKRVYRKTWISRFSINSVFGLL